jgi:ferredoxin-type protein NapG
MCEDIPCVKACPTGALDHALTDINKSKMGLAVLVGPGDLPQLPRPALRHLLPRLPGDRQGDHAGAAANARTGKHALFIPTVHSEPAPAAASARRPASAGSRAIKVLRPNWPRASSGKHYRLGWEEQQKAGGSLVATGYALICPDRLPEGMRYESGTSTRAATAGGHRRGAGRARLQGGKLWALPAGRSRGCRERRAAQRASACEGDAR